MKTQSIIRKMFLLPIIVFLVAIIPGLALASSHPPPSSIIPCGFDLNGDTTIKDTPSVWTAGPHEECYFEDVIILAQKVINFLIFSIAAPLGAVMFAYAGFLYVTNRGNEGQVKQAHDIFLYVFWGLVVALGAWVLVSFILEFFLGTGSPFNFLSP